MKMPKFKSEREEADWLYAHRREIEAELSNTPAKVKGKTPTIAEIIAKETRTKP
jgi:hypothetical protein